MEKKMNLFVLLLLCLFAGNANSINDADEVKFLVAISPTQTHTVHHTEFMQLRNSYFDKTLPTLFIIHGFLTNSKTFIGLFRTAYTHKLGWMTNRGLNSTFERRVNLIGIDWSLMSNGNFYPYAMVLTELVGNTVGQFIKNAIDAGVMLPDKTHIIGHSLGAHAAGFAGKYLQRNNLRLTHITGLDPAGPIIGLRHSSKRIWRTDADFVEIVHTNGGILGVLVEVGPVDYYINGGTSQPQCYLRPSCAHAYAHEWYREVVSQKLAIFYGWKCHNFFEIANVRRCGDPLECELKILGNVDGKHNSIYYVPTDSIYKQQEKSLSKNCSQNQDDHTIVMFAINEHFAQTLSGLLNDDRHTEVKVNQKYGLEVMNPIFQSLQSNSKYVICNETKPENVEQFLNTLKKPYRFAIVFDITEMFEDPFWDLLFYLMKKQKDTTCNELKQVVLNIPHDDVTLDEHIDQLSSIIKNALPDELAPADFEMKALHQINQNGFVRQQPELIRELDAIKRAIGIL